MSSELWFFYIHNDVIIYIAEDEFTMIINLGNCTIEDAMRIIWIAADLVADVVGDISQDESIEAILDELNFQCFVRGGPFESDEEESTAEEELDENNVEENSSENNSSENK